MVEMCFFTLIASTFCVLIRLMFSAFAITGLFANALPVSLLTGDLSYSMRTSSHARTKSPLGMTRNFCITFIETMFHELTLLCLRGLSVEHCEPYVLLLIGESEHYCVFRVFISIN